MHRIFYFLEILDIIIKTVFLNIFQDDINYSSFIKKKKAVVLMIDSLLFINKKFYCIVREYNYYFILKFTMKENVKRNIVLDIKEVVEMTIGESYTMKNFNTFKKYKCDNSSIPEYSRYHMMYYYILYLERGFDDKKNNWSILK